MSRLFKRFSSTLTETITIKSTPSKTHLHRPLPTSSFPTGYLATGIHAGVKKKPGVLDLGLIVSTSEHPASAAACFTRNAFKAAPVVVSDQILTKNGGRARAVVVNSGCANAAAKVWRTLGQWSARPTLSCPPSTFMAENHTLVMSTGVIGQNLPISKIVDGIRSQATTARTLASDFPAWERAAKAFMTTDTFPKLRSRVFTINGTEFRMAGMDKGAGMIHPNMGPATTSFPALHATLLGCIFTDAAVSPRSLQSALTYAVERSFNSISVDGEMSTNDTILVLANGAAASKNGKVIEIDEETDKEGYETFKTQLTEFAVELAQLVVRDGEGATKFVTVNVKGAPTYEIAHRVASRISTSALVKTAFYGEDANWGRILSAAGSISVPGLDPSKVSVTFVPSDNTGSLPVLVNGEPENVDEVRAKEILSLEDFGICIDLGGLGNEEATYWTCDFSYDYVRINGDYRS
ncbi:Arginine biosynthesis bifunctional protein ArgJ, mitochondrial [Mycena venus]|uniref:Arginine biosynthesis bifunctional protein ArgJ, mitochondrial n=1 Tax=Mycena venus TaxID=2733690 RepID=A0A8H6YDY6_9AGAR|nr:Arginine biosynthesis bifunctional protein ArgJ, mitochondrial [Mycena venus]